MTPEDLARTHAAAFLHGRPWGAGEFADLLANRFVHAFGNVECFALVQIIGDEAELLTIATHPDYQRRGLAQSCMTDWHRRAASTGATRAFLEVAADNAGAIALYERCGYAPCGLRRGYYRRAGEEAVDAILMERDLP